ncbi:MAG: histidine kinase dimerization/phospho-acceptor domain-containing protein [Terriglobales bacterium]
MEQATVLIIADDPHFSRTVVSRWQTERSVPAFTVVSSDVWQENGGPYELAIVGAMPAVKLINTLQILDNSTPQRPAICVCKDAGTVQQLRDSFPRLLVLRPYEGWLDALMLVAGEALRRVEANARTIRAEEIAHTKAREATLGRYILEMRHNINNALTSVLGNAELLLLEPGTLSTEVREQIDTIHSMALRLHEILQRFSSLDAEMNFAEKRSQSETHSRVHGFAAGS